MEEGGWFNSKDVFVKDSDLQNRMLNVFGVYWHIIVKVTGIYLTERIFMWEKFFVIHSNIIFVCLYFNNRSAVH